MVENVGFYSLFSFHKIFLKKKTVLLSQNIHKIFLKKKPVLLSQNIFEKNVLLSQNIFEKKVLLSQNIFEKQLFAFQELGALFRHLCIGQEMQIVKNHKWMTIQMQLLPTGNRLAEQWIGMASYDGVDIAFVYR